MERSWRNEAPAMADLRRRLDAAHRGLLRVHKAIIDHERTGLLVDNTSETIAAAIRRLLAEPVLGERMAAEARRSVEERFSVSHMVSATLQVYERIVK